MVLILAPLLIFISSLLCSVGCISPYMIAATAISVGLLFKLGFHSVLFVTVCCYLTGFLSQATLIGRGFSNTSSVSLLSNKANKLTYDESYALTRAHFILRAIGLAVFTLIRQVDIPKLPSIAVLILGIFLIFVATQEFRAKPLDFFVMLVCQVLILKVCFLIFDQFDLSGQATLSLIPAIVVPNLFFSNEKDGSSPVKIIRWWLIIVAIAIAFYAPGLGLGVIINGIFPHSPLRPNYASLVEGAVEGMVLYQFLINKSSTKTALGDLLTSSPFHLGQGEIDLGSFGIIILAVLVAITVSKWAIVRFHDLPDYVNPRHAITFSLMAQAFATAGLWCLLFLAGGFLIQYIKTKLQITSNSCQSLAFLTPML